MFFTGHPVEFAKFVDERVGRVRYEELWEEARTPTKMDWQQVYESLINV